MSDYVRVKAVRFKFPEEIVKEIKKEIEEKNLWESVDEILTKQYKVLDKYQNKLNEFTINSGLNYETDEYDYFLDYMLDYEYGASGDFENVRLLTNSEFEKYQKIFSKYFNIIENNKLRLVHYCYYNGVDEPAVWEIEEI